jgi:hypothetical protein
MARFKNPSQMFVVIPSGILDVVGILFYKNIESIQKFVVDTLHKDVRSP